MKHVACNQCNQLVPMNESLGIRGRQLCKPCAESDLLQHADEVSADSIVRSVDPTVCAQCGNDNGELDLPTLAGLPLCGSCEQGFRNRSYPTWLKISFAALLALAAFCLARNWRFIAAYREMHRMQRAFTKGDIEQAAILGEMAAQHVPDVPELSAIASVYRGMAHMAKDEDAEALKCFQKAAQNPATNTPGLLRLKLMAEASVAFDAKDYDLFLKKAQEIARLAPNESIAVAGLASAYACKYAVTGNEEFRKSSLKHLDQAVKLAPSGDSNFQDFSGRIHHRLETREIISRTEYARRFPSGYQPGKKP